ncbi:GDSL esterase/lipase [Acorus gramineus]|uniref:GDSL esterase/lipase n=1 Tax=Acorus gramineus TaxID=55184 RepID=A0AAV9ACJ6_ACOGR|nr:GDSL esterase/lipase [Acorus gramineus]
MYCNCSFFCARHIFNSGSFIDSVYSFGDSMADTGNLLIEGPAPSPFPIDRLPYGVTYFHRPTGRCFDGLIMIDFLGTIFAL